MSNERRHRSRLIRSGLVWGRLVRGRLVRSRLVRGGLVSRGIRSRSIGRSRGVGRSWRISRGRGVSRSRCIRGGRGIGRLAVGRVGSLSRVHNISNIATVVISNIVVDSLQPAVREGHRVGAAGAITIALLLVTELVAIVVIYTIVEGIGRRIVGGLLVGRVGRSIGWCWSISWCRGIAVPGCIWCRCSSSQGSQSKDDERLKIFSFKKSFTLYE